jgi:hypothetical protein
MKRVRCLPRDYSSSFEALCYLHIHRGTFNRVRGTRGGQSGDDWADFWCLNRNKNQLGRYSDTLHEHQICLLLKLSVDAPTWKDANHTLELWNCSIWNISGGRPCSGTVSTKHTLQRIVSGQTPEIAFSRPLGFAVGLWAPIAPSMPMCYPMYK